MASAKVEGTSFSEILEVKNNPPEPVKTFLISNSDTFLNIEAGLEKFHKHYQNLAPTKEEEGIINAEYVENIITMLQNDSEKAYIIEPNKKIAQAIFLPLVKIAQLVSIRNQKELRITAKRISEFGSTKRIDVPVNMAEKKIVDKREIIFTC
ncbi:hypothetical protein G9A89_011401 [Geosiphon pyriformis]|nr:hypothetical protein G9A89_011401 [Geosiphon pyriformis]